jgi:hypothetical protein
VAFRDFFAYERESDRSLVVGAGIPAEWIDAGEVAVVGLPTWYGKLDLSLRRTAEGAIAVRLGGDLSLPPGGVRIAPALAGPVREVWSGGTPSAAFTDTEVHVAAVPAEILIVG